MATRKTPGKRTRKPANNGASNQTASNQTAETRNGHTPTLVEVKEQVGFEDIQRRAYELYLGRGRCDGHDLADWFAAELELMTPLSSR